MAQNDPRESTLDPFQNNIWKISTMFETTETACANKKGIPNSALVQLQGDRRGSWYSRREGKNGKGIHEKRSNPFLESTLLQNELLSSLSLSSERGNFLQSQRRENRHTLCFPCVGGPPSALVNCLPQVGLALVGYRSTCKGIYVFLQGWK